MKKIISIILTVISIFSIFILPTNAISVNYCEIFDYSFYNLQWYIDRDYNNTKESEQFPIGVILDYTYSCCDFKEEYGRGNIGDLGYDFYAFPADYFEAQAKKYFDIVNVNDLRNYGAYNGQYNVRYNNETNEYIGINPGGWGGAASYIIYGYTENGKSRYTTYGYVGIRTGEEGYLKMIKENPETENERGYIHTGGILSDGDKEILLIDSYLKSVVSHNGENVKFHSLETIDNLPDINGLITPDTKVEISTSSTPASSQTTVTNQNSSNQDSSITVSPESNTDTEHASVSNDIITESRTSSEASAVQTNTELTSSNESVELSGNTESIVESGNEISTVQEKTSSSPKNNTVWIIVIICLGVIVFGVGGYFIFLKNKR